MDGHVNMTINDIKSHSPLLAGAHVIQAINSSHDGLVYYIKLSNEEQGVEYIMYSIVLHVIVIVDKLLDFNSSSFRRAYLVHLLDYHIACYHGDLLSRQWIHHYMGYTDCLMLP